MIHKITINAVLNGFVVQVGCQTVVFESRQKLLSELDGYLRNPDTVLKQYSENAIHHDMLNCPIAVPPYPDTFDQQAQTANAVSPTLTIR